MIEITSTWIAIIIGTGAATTALLMSIGGPRRLRAHNIKDTAIVTFIPTRAMLMLIVVMLAASSEPWKALRVTGLIPIMFSTFGMDALPITRGICTGVIMWASHVTYARALRVNVEGFVVSFERIGRHRIQMHMRRTFQRLWYENGNPRAFLRAAKESVTTQRIQSMKEAGVDELVITSLWLAERTNGSKPARRLDALTTHLLKVAPQAKIVSVTQKGGIAAALAIGAVQLLGRCGALPNSPVWRPWIAFAEKAARLPRRGISPDIDMPGVLVHL